MSSKTGRKPAAKRNGAAISLAAEWNVAAGVALAQTLTGSSGMAMVFSRGSFADPLGLKEALALSAARKLPIVYALWNDGNHGGSKAQATLGCEIVGSAAEACGVPVIAVDGTDAVAVYRVAQESLQRARNHDGPTVIECRSAAPGRRPEPGAGRRYSGGEHASVSSAPMQKMERYLIQKNLFTRAWKQEELRALRAELKVEMRRVRQNRSR